MVSIEYQRKEAVAIVKHLKAKERNGSDRNRRIAFSTPNPRVAGLLLDTVLARAAGHNILGWKRRARHHPHAHAAQDQHEDYMIAQMLDALSEEEKSSIPKRSAKTRSAPTCITGTGGVWPARTIAVPGAMFPRQGGLFLNVYKSTTRPGPRPKPTSMDCSKPGG